jgi:NAD(P)H-flavin reductase
MFKPVLVVATGSGIGPCLGIFLALRNHPFRILWSTKSPEKTYGAEIARMVYNADPNATIVDTDVTGRCDIVALTEQKVSRSGCRGNCHHFPQNHNQSSGCGHVRNRHYFLWPNL